MRTTLPRLSVLLIAGLLFTGCAGFADFIRNMEEVDPSGVFSSTGEVMTYNVLFPEIAFQPWTGGCSIDPGVDLQSNWGVPRDAVKHGKDAHDWQSLAELDGFSANWVTSEPMLETPGDLGQAYSRFTSELTGDGVFDLFVLADDCAWIYIDGEHIDSQGTEKSFTRSTIVGLDGTHTLDIVVYDGGGIGGLMFSLDTREAPTDKDRGASARPQ